MCSLIETWQATRWIVWWWEVHTEMTGKNNRESRFIFHGAQGRTRTDTPCGGGFWVPCVYQFRHLGSGFGLLENDIIKHKYSVSTNFCKNIKKDGWCLSVLNKNSDLIWVKKVGVTMWDRVFEMQSEIKFAARCDWWLIESVYCVCDGMCVMKYRLRMCLRRGWERMVEAEFSQLAA